MKKYIPNDERGIEDRELICQRKGCGHRRDMYMAYGVTDGKPNWSESIPVCPRCSRKPRIGSKWVGTIGLESFYGEVVGVCNWESPYGDHRLVVLLREDNGLYAVLTPMEMFDSLREEDYCSSVGENKDE